MIEAFTLREGGLLPAGDRSAPVLLCSDPDARELAWLQQAFPLDSHRLASALDPDDVSRLEVQGDELFLIWKRPERYAGGARFAFEVSSFGLLWHPERLVVISAGQSLLAGEGPVQPLHDPLDVLVELLFRSVHHYQGHLKVIRLVGRELQQRFDSSLGNEHLLQMFNLSESLIHYINALQGNGAVLDRLRQVAERRELGEALRARLEDLIIENDQCRRQADLYATVFARLMDARGNLANNSMNLTLRNLTLINVVFLPLNLIAGIGGMSEFSMMTAGHPWWLSYSLLLVAMAALSLALTWILRRSLRRRAESAARAA